MSEAGKQRHPREVAVELVLEYWRLLRTLDSAAEKMAPTDRRRATQRVRFGRDRLESLLQGLGIRLEHFDGKPFGASLAAEPVNADEFPPDARVVVEATVQPAVVAGTEVLRLGRVLLRRAAEGDGDVSGN